MKIIAFKFISLSILYFFMLAQASGQVVEKNKSGELIVVFDDGSWLLLRMSGTEPVVRCYAETNTKKDLEVLLETGSKFVLN